MNAWTSMILKNPEEEIEPGLKCKHAAVMPEAAAGADGVFAAFNAGGVILVSMCNHWTDDKTCDSKKISDQESKSVLSNQFQDKNCIGIECPSFSPVLAKRKRELDDMLNEGSSLFNRKYLRVLIEFPGRSQIPKVQQVDMFIVDCHNAEAVFGFDDSFFNNK